MVKGESVYQALNLCRLTGLERLYSVELMPNRHMIRVYRDNFQQYRLVAFKSAAHNVGYAGIIIDGHGYIKHSGVCPAMRHAQAVKALQWYAIGKGLSLRDSLCVDT